VIALEPSILKQRLQRTVHAPHALAQVMSPARASTAWCLTLVAYNVHTASTKHRLRAKQPRLKCAHLSITSWTCACPFSF
jgi:hypothetical protein